MLFLKPITTAVFCFIVSLSFSQTTVEEYNYLSKGYKIQQASGLDMKKGYSIKELDTWGVTYSNFSRNTTFKHLYRDGQTTPCATLMILERSNTSYKSYICIPHIDTDTQLWKRAWVDFSAATPGWSESSRAYAWGMIKMVSFLSSNPQ